MAVSQTRSLRKLRHLKPRTRYLEADICPVDVVVGHIKVQCRGLFDTCEWDGHVVVVRLQGDPVDGGSASEHQEGLRDNAGLHVAQQLQANGAAALGGMRGEEAEMAAPSIPIRTWVGSCEENTALDWPRRDTPHSQLCVAVFLPPTKRRQRKERREKHGWWPLKPSLVRSIGSDKTAGSHHRQAPVPGITSLLIVATQYSKSGVAWPGLQPAH